MYHNEKIILANVDCSDVDAKVGAEASKALLTQSSAQYEQGFGGKTAAKW